MSDCASGCGCCAGVTRSTPRPLDQRHGLPVIRYRAGMHADFLASLTAALADADLPALAGLRTRDPRDFTMALLDGVATVCDVITFYTERLAQESFLRTARDRGSLRELGRLVAYRLRPGVAAATHLAFFVEPPPPAAGDAAFAPAPYLRDGVVLPKGLPVRSVPGPGEAPETFETGEQITARPELNALRLDATKPTVFGEGEGRRRVYLSGTGHRLRPGDRLLFANGSTRQTTTLTAATEQPEEGRTLVTWAPDLTTALPSGSTLHVLRKRVGIFGHTAPPRSLVEETSDEWPFDVSPESSHAVDLDGSHADILAGSYLVLERTGGTTQVQVSAIRELSRSGYALSSRITRVTVDVDVSGFDDAVRDTVVHAASEPLPVAPEPDASPLSGTLLVLDGPVTLPAGRRMLLAGLGGSEVVTVVVAQPTSTVTYVLLAAAPVGTYPRDTAVLYGNVAPATHGETVHQVLGSGRGSAAHQRFELKHAPLTHVPSDDPAGARSTLTVRVNDVEWHERPTLYGARPEDRAFVTRDTENGGVAVLFGDGVRGTRLPTGTGNVRAEYRRGIGQPGNVGAGAISQVMDPPLGLSKVTNPSPATGGADPEPASAARDAIPLAVRTLGRAVSLLDYVDYARAYAGIAKADAAVLDLLGGRTIVVTVAGPGGAKVPAETRGRLLDSLKSYGDPMVSVVVLGHRAAAFRLALRYQRDPDHLADVVTAAIRAEVAGAFAFAARRFGQPVHRSEVVAAVHRVPGVVAVDLDTLYRLAPPAPPEPGWPASSSAGLSDRLLAAAPRASAGGPLAAELLLAAAPDPFDTLEEMS